MNFTISMKLKVHLDMLLHCLMLAVVVLANSGALSFLCVECTFFKV